MTRRHAAHRRRAAAAARDGHVLTGVIGVVLAAVVAAAVVGVVVLIGRDGATAPAPGTRVERPLAAATSLPTSASPMQSQVTPSPSTPATPRATSAATPQPTPKVRARPAALVRCRDTLRAADAAIAAGGIGVQHWQDHLGAQSNLAAGRWTLSRTAAVWTRTRLAGPADVDRFTAAYRSYRQVGDDCAAVARVSGTYHARAVDCAKAQRAADRTVEAIRAVLDDWAHHLRRMADFRDGDLAAVQAQDMWIHAWRAAPPALDNLAAARTALARAPGCRVGSSG